MKERSAGIIITKRIVSSLIVLFLLVSFIFILLRVSPGDPSQKFISPELSPELIKKISRSFNLDRPIIEQYISFIGNIFTGNFGISYNYRLPVLEVIIQYLPFTLLLAFLSFSFQLIFAIASNAAIYKRMNSYYDKLLSKLSITFFAVPTFVLGVLLIFLFSVQIDIFPSNGTRSIDFDSMNFVEKLWDYFIHLLLPLFTLSVGGASVFYKYLRDNIDEVYQKLFVVKLRSDGFTEKQIFWKHILPNSIMPLISVAGIELGFLLSGTLITEVIFGLPGMGRLTINSIFTRDYPLVVGCTFISGMLMIFSNLIADLIKIKIDKRLIKDLMN
jgi:peptide/nickel transport system permease protein